MENNKMVSLNTIMNDCFRACDVYIPLIQRNYKWDAETSSKLATDLWWAYKKKRSTYTLGMITFYKDLEDTNNSIAKMQLIDGQQRITTLLMLLKYIQPYNEHFTFRFERDKGIKRNDLKRQTYLNNIAVQNDWEESDMYTDVTRFKNNYEAIKEGLEKVGYTKEDAQDFSRYIADNVYLLLHISETEPFDEFINLNKNKTRFVISDRIKANLIIESKEKSDKENVLNLFQDLSEILFNKEDVWELVQQGYIETNLPKNDEKRYKDKHYPDENRLKILCCERHGSDELDGNSILKYELNEELAHLTHYKDILFTFSNDLAAANWNSYNAYNCLYELNNELRFFKMLNNNLGNKLEQDLLRECENLGKAFVEACFVESQLGEGKLSLDYIKVQKGIQTEFNNSNGDRKFWLHNGASEFEIFKLIYLDYIDEKYKSNAEVILW